MNNSLLIGASGFLGSRIVEKHNPVICPLRFEDNIKRWISYSVSNEARDIDNIILLARTCRKKSPRRDRKTMINEISGVTKILQAFPSKHIVFASTKVVYGLTEDSVRPMDRDSIIQYIQKSLSGSFINKTVDLPEEKFEEGTISSLGKEHQIYAETKLCDEMLIRHCAKSYTIFRIWDIV